MSSPFLPHLLLFPLVREISLELIEALVPEALIVIHPSRDIAKRLAAKRDEDFAALFPALDQSRPLEQLQVLRHRVQSDVERLRDVEKSGGPMRELSDDRAPRRVRDCGQDVAQA